MYACNILFAYSLTLLLHIVLLFQLEDVEFARLAAVKAKQNSDLEVTDLQQQLDDVMRNKSDLEDKLMKANRERSDVSQQLEDNEEELQEVMKKYKASVSQVRHFPTDKQCT